MDSYILSYQKAPRWNSRWRQSLNLIAAVATLFVAWRIGGSTFLHRIELYELFQQCRKVAVAPNQAVYDEKTPSLSFSGARPGYYLWKQEGRPLFSYFLPKCWQRLRELTTPWKESDNVLLISTFESFAGARLVVISCDPIELYTRRNDAIPLRIYVVEHSVTGVSGTMSDVQTWKLKCFNEAPTGKLRVYPGMVNLENPNDFSIRFEADDKERLIRGTFDPESVTIRFADEKNSGD